MPPGTVIGRYSIKRLLGEGGMGAVYEAVHADLQKRVAVKTLHRRIAGSADARARFLREGQAASRIRHDHVVDVYDVGVEQDVPYLVMEYLEGESLAELLERQGKLPVEQIADIMVPVVAALAVAHDMSVIHRDLKPENIFLCNAAGRMLPKVLDFGISKVIDEAGGHALTGTAALLGTPYYMSPEQAQNAKEIDQRSDQYSLGVILYECAVGARPFGDDTLYTLLQKIVAGQFDPPRKLDSDIPEDFEALILRAMSRDPADRFDSVRDMGQELLAFAGDATRVLFAAALSEEAELPSAPKAARVSSSRAAATPEPAGISYSGASATLGSGEVPVTRFPSRAVAIGVGALALAVGVGWWATRAPAPIVTEPLASSSQSVVPAAPEPTASAPEPAESAVVAPVEQVEKELRSEPPGAEVYLDGKRLGTTPYKLEIPPDADSLKVELRAPRHVTEERTVTREDPDAITVTLKRQVSQRPAAQGRPPRRTVPELAPR